MNAGDLLLELSRRGVAVEPHGDKLLLLPKGAAGDLLPEVARFKPQLLELLAPQLQPNHSDELFQVAIVAAAQRRLELHERRANGGAAATWGELREINRIAAQANGRDDIKSHELLEWAHEVLTSE